MPQRMREFVGLAGQSIPVLPVDLDRIRPLLQRVAEREAREADAVARRAAPVPVRLPPRRLGDHVPSAAPGTLAKA